MNDINSSLLTELRQIIKNYRKAEIDITLDEKHILKWINQFDENSRNIILRETVHVLKMHYYTHEDVKKYLQGIISYLAEKVAKCSTKEVFNTFVFSLIQKKGLSQNALLSMIEEYAKREGVSVSKSPTMDCLKYVYIDDGIYSGNRAIEDLTDLLRIIPNNSEVYVFHFVATTFGTEEVRKELRSLSENKGVRIEFLSWKKIDNNRKPVITSTYTEGDTEEYYQHMCLWPEKRVLNNPEVTTFINRVREIFPNQQFEFRGYPWSMQAGLFTSTENRRVVEEEFLLKGLYIYQFCDKSKKNYPLGGSCLRTFGTGTFCAFEDNISNTCPLVLWWGNVEPKGDAMDNWYPLLPRRINGDEESAFY